MGYTLRLAASVWPSAIGARSPAEIAVSILAQVIDVLRRAR